MKVRISTKSAGAFPGYKQDIGEDGRVLSDPSRPGLFCIDPCMGVEVPLQVFHLGESFTADGA